MINAKPKTPVSCVLVDHNYEISQLRTAELNILAGLIISSKLSTFPLLCSWGLQARSVSCKDRVNSWSQH